MIFKNSLLLLLLLSMIFLSGCLKQKKSLNTNVPSPSGNISIAFQLRDDGAPTYLVKYEGKTVIDTSTMGFEFRKQPPYVNGFEIVGVDKSSFNETWEMPWGEQRLVNNHYNEMVIKLLKKVLSSATSG